MGVTGQYGEIFTMTREMMGTFSIALYENPALAQTQNSTLGNPAAGMFEYFARWDAVEALW